VEQKVSDLTLISPLYAETTIGENARMESIPSRIDLGGFGNDRPPFNPRVVPASYRKGDGTLLWNRRSQI
jgi:hypothetical protein